MNRRYEYNEYERADRSKRQRTPPAPRRRTSGRWFLILLLVVVAALWFAPTILLQTGLRNKVVAWAVPDFPGKVVIGSGTGGWMSPIELRDIAIWDADGNAIASIPLLRTEKQPSAWISNPGQLGEFKLHNPEIQLVVTQDGSNLEELLKPFMTASGEPAPAATTDANPLVGLGLEIIEGRVIINDQVSQTTSVVENLNLQLKVPDAPPAPIELALSASAQQDAARGNIVANVSWLMPTQITETDLGDGTVEFKSDGFPLVALRPFLRRSGSDLHISGQLASDLSCQWRHTPKGPAIEAKGIANVSQTHVQMPSVLGTDHLRLKVLKTSLDVASQDNMINLNSIRVDSDVANLEIKGSAGLAELLSSGSIVTKILDWKSSHQFQVLGNVDVAGLARQLPSTIQLRDDTQISQGQISLNLLSRIELGQRAIQGAVRTGRIEAMSAGRMVSWDKPLQLNLNAASSVDGVTIQRLSCESDFLQVNGKGTLQHGDLTAKGDLSELITQIEKFSDLGDLQLAGQLAAAGAWQRTSAGQYETSVESKITNFAAASSQMTPIREEELRVKASGRFGIGLANELTNIEMAELTVSSGEDRLVTRLTTPIKSPTAESQWPVSLKLVGHTETWIARLQPFIDTSALDIHAGIDATMAGRVHPSFVNLNPVKIQLTNVAARAPGWLIREPEMTVEGSLHWDGIKNTVATPSLTLNSQSIAARAGDINITVDGEQTTATGVVAFRGNVQRMWGWQYSDQPLTTYAQGDMSGQAQLATENGIITFQANTEVKNFVLQQRSATQVPGASAGNPWAPVWTEPELRIVANGSYDPKSDQLSLTAAEANGEGVTLVAGGRLNALTATPQADIKGEVSYDLASLTNKLRASLGPDIRLTGNKKTQFAIRGPLVASSVSVETASSRQFSAGDYARPDTATVSSSGLPMIPLELLGEAGLGWDAIQAYGVSLGPQEISTRLQQGTLFFSPLQTSVGGGQLHLAPRIEFNASPMTLALDQGSIEQIQITPEMFRTWFKFIAPMLANAATAEGQLSVALHQVRVPIEQPMAANLSGKVTIHGARVEAGPMAQQVLGMVKEVSTLLNRSGPRLDFLNAGEKWMELAPQDIDFQMTQGRVHHRNLELRAGKVAIRTQGWVGVDQTVGMLAEIPVQDEWIDGRKILESLRGQSIQIPVHGTFAKPQLDRGAIAKLSRQLIGNGAERLIQQELQKGLQKLLRPK